MSKISEAIAKGWRVFPLRYKVPLTPHGCKDAVGSLDAAKELFSQYPDTTGYGIATGGGLVVVDVDPPHGGRESLVQLENIHGKLPTTYTVTTGSGGSHYYYHSANPIRSKNGVLGAGLDVKGEGGYVVGPGSQHESGNQYVVTLSTALAELPEWIGNAIGTANEPTPAATRASGNVGQGGRNSYLASVAGSMVRRGVSAAAVAQALNVENQQRCDPPLLDYEVASIAASICRYEPSEPLITEVAGEPEPEPDEPGVTSQQVVDAIKGSRLEVIVRCLQSVANPPLPIELTLPKAIVLAGCALSQRGIAVNGFGARLAKFYVHTGAPMLCNAWGLIVAPSGSGKDMGNVDSQLARDKNYLLGSAGSAEGIFDGLAEKNGGLLRLNEFEPFFTRNHWQALVKSPLTALWSNAFFEQLFSKRGKNQSSRKSDFAPISILAGIQPSILRKNIQTSDVESGFLGRFLTTFTDEARVVCPSCLSQDESRHLYDDALAMLSAFEQYEGVITIEPNYLHELRQDVSKACNGLWQRYVNEYGPRLAIMLAGSVSDANEKQPTITQDAWMRVGVLLQWFYRAAEKAYQFGGDERQERFEDLLDRWCKAIRKRNGKLTNRQLDQRFSYGTDTALRKKIREELLARGWARINNEGNLFVIKGQAKQDAAAVSAPRADSLPVKVDAAPAFESEKDNSPSVAPCPKLEATKSPSTPATATHTDPLASCAPVDFDEEIAGSTVEIDTPRPEAKCDVHNPSDEIRNRDYYVGPFVPADWRTSPKTYWHPDIKPSGKPFDSTKREDGAATVLGNGVVALSPDELACYVVE